MGISANGQPFAEAERVLSEGLQREGREATGLVDREAQVRSGLAQKARDPDAEADKGREGRDLRWTVLQAQPPLTFISLIYHINHPLYQISKGFRDYMR